ncbi:hypothetical protein LCGC14_0597150 [marine sediment metagenome]|uniref:Uncharacterized protein n=1 Tax=marine sediment metagenome TaxID=412755 RepID=A0A0F9RVG1_9ZZZZ
MTTIGAQIIIYIIFLLVEVLWADILRNYLNTLYLGGSYTIPFLILLIGILISFLVSFIIYMIVIKNDKFLVFILCLTSTILTSLILVFVSFIVIEYSYPDIFAEFSILEKFMLIPQYVVYYAIYILESPVLLWDITSIIFGVFMLMLIKLFIYEEKRKKKLKPLLERII